MEQMTASQEQARRFNEDEAVWQRYEYLRALRLLIRQESRFYADVADALDWIEANHQCRGNWLPCVRLKLKIITKQ